MMPNDIRALDVQRRRIRCYLYLAGQECLRRQFESDWHEAETPDDRLTVITRWVECIAEAEALIFGGDHAA